MSNSKEILGEYQEPRSYLNNIFNSKPQPEKRLWEKVKEIEEQYISVQDQDKKLNELGEFKATMIVNFGENGKHTKGLVTENQTATQMMISVLEKFIEKK